MNENADDGIDVDSADTTVMSNTANRNDDLGIEVVPSQRRRREQASGDRNPLQCTNVFCR